MEISIYALSRVIIAARKSVNLADAINGIMVDRRGTSMADEISGLLFDALNDEIGERATGKDLSMSDLYWMLRNPFLTDEMLVDRIATLVEKKECVTQPPPQLLTKDQLKEMFNKDYGYRSREAESK